MNKATVRRLLRLLEACDRDVAIHIPSCDFPRRLSLQGLLVVLAVLPLVGVVDSAPAAESGWVTARVLPTGAAREAVLAASGLRSPAQGTPGFGDLPGNASLGSLELMQDGAWIRVSTAPIGPSDGKRWVSVVYLGN